MNTFTNNDFRRPPQGAQDDPARYVRRVLAVDPQPEVRTPSELDPELWMGDRKRRQGSSLADVEHDNTLHAGLALIAMLVFDGYFLHRMQPVTVAAEAAVEAYRQAARLDDDEEFGVVLTELFAAAMHLMDARGVDLQAPDELGVSLGTMLFALESHATGEWIDRLGGEQFADLLAAAHAHYWDQVADVDPSEPEQVARTRPVAAVWTTQDGTAREIKWCMDPVLHRNSAGTCLCCLFAWAASETPSLPPTCPGLEAHLAEHLRKITAHLGADGVDSAVLAVPAQLSTHEAVVSAIEQLIKQG